jgi:hypothetical protein
MNTELNAKLMELAMSDIKSIKDGGSLLVAQTKVGNVEIKRYGREYQFLQHQRLNKVTNQVDFKPYYSFFQTKKAAAEYLVSLYDVVVE